MKHGDRHYFDINGLDFCCELDYDYKERWLWYVEETLPSLFGCDKGRGFRTKEACELYMKKHIKSTCKHLLKGLK